ncbi:2-dehydropantoate 2-reductase [Devosia enhydra]|uniref:2-dehydropantoate 2-reductase n=1 Tax=Devosia enhydra TaxID=665118 RepID=A0A1K2I0Z3_9HYPH|nr:ketopantoate reductase family protein [Devosia enhydra]SFZ85452.1 2-dehydropantoate 2-reductase [Devosia enhydra]
MSNTILIWGAGAVGGTLGAFMARAGEDVLLVDVVPEHVEAINAHGLTIEGPVESFTQPMRAVGPADLKGQFKTVILAVKALHTEAATQALLPHLALDGVVVSAQNGLNELTIGGIVGAERTIGCFVNFGADWLGPGRILLGNRGKVAIGELDGATTARIREIHRLFSLYEPDAELTANIWGYLWGKMGYGGMLFATALTPASMSDNFASAKHAAVFMALGREVMAVARARGVTPLGFNGFDPKAFMPGATEADALVSIRAMEEHNRHTAKTHSGVWRDIAVRKRKTEVDAQFGIIVGLAEDVGVKVPVTRKLIDLVHQVETGRPQGWDVLDELLTSCA